MSGPKAHYENGRVSYPDADALKADVEPFLKQQMLWVAGSGLPSAMIAFSFELRLPGGTQLSLSGEIVSVRPDGAMIKVWRWSDADWSAIQSACTVGCATYTNDEVRYPDEDSLKRDFDAFLRHGILHVQGEKFPGPVEPFQFRLSLPNRPTRALTGMIISLRAGHGLIQVFNWDPAILLEPEPEPEPTPNTETIDVPSPRVTEERATSSIEARTGRFENPRALADLAKLPVKSDSMIGELQDPCTMIELIRWCGHMRTTALLTAGKKLAVIRRGRVLVPKGEHDATIDAMSATRGDYELDPDAADDVSATETTISYSAWGFVLQILRRTLKEISNEALRAELSHGRPKLTTTKTELLAKMKLSSFERRFMNMRLDGEHPVESIHRAAVVSEDFALQLIALLDLAGMLEWTSPHRRASAAQVNDEVRVLYEERAKDDLFAAIGAHYIDGPTRLEEAYHEVMKGFGPGSAAHTKSPEWAGKIVRLAETAWAVLRQKDSRLRYRKEVLRLDVVSAAAVLVDQASTALMRGESESAKKLIADAYDLHREVQLPPSLKALGRLS